MESTAPSPVPDTFDSNDLLKQFDQLQSNKPDIVAQAMELASIPTDMNNNSDILSKAMEMSDITSDIMMEFWFDSDAMWLLVTTRGEYNVILIPI